MAYIIKLTAGVRYNGRLVDGEYGVETGDTIEDARAEAIGFAENTVGGSIWIGVACGDALAHVETVR